MKEIFLVIVLTALFLFFGVANAAITPEQI